MLAVLLAALPASAQDEAVRAYEPPISGPPIPSRHEAAEMGDQRQREILRGPFRNQQDQRRGRDELDVEGFEQPRLDDED